MDAPALLARLREFFPSTPDLMRHISPGSCWHYIVYASSLDDQAPVLEFYLRKRDDGSIDMFTNPPAEKPDLLLYFTEQALLRLVDGNPPADEYYARYKQVMDHPEPGVELDNKVNKSKLVLFKAGYQAWQKDFKF
ncbi:MAG: hypothetical protein GYA24_25880 [Candidatus Lokiarchaeota archaeon]|nr:hypothetical protein [Candidatus Lokiarchaeota archaeon]